MNPIQHLRRLAAVVAGLAAALVAFGATPAFASLPPGHVLGRNRAGYPPVSHVHTIVTGGIPGWQIALIVIAALFAAATAVLVDRARAARRTRATAAA
jgi:hypothetical protein